MPTRGEEIQTVLLVNALVRMSAVDNCFTKLSFNHAIFTASGYVSDMGVVLRAAKKTHVNGSVQVPKDSVIGQSAFWYIRDATILLIEFGQLEYHKDPCLVSIDLPLVCSGTLRDGSFPKKKEFVPSLTSGFGVHFFGKYVDKHFESVEAQDDVLRTFESVVYHALVPAFAKRAIFRDRRELDFPGLQILQADLQKTFFIEDHHSEKQF
ncbi:hypothetical protein Tco_0193675 [Tanacetum coccineum]